MVNWHLLVHLASNSNGETGIYWYTLHSIQMVKLAFTGTPCIQFRWWTGIYWYTMHSSQMVKLACTGTPCIQVRWWNWHALVHPASKSDGETGMYWCTLHSIQMVNKPGCGGWRCPGMVIDGRSHWKQNGTRWCPEDFSHISPGRIPGRICRHNLQLSSKDWTTEVRSLRENCGQLQPRPCTLYTVIVKQLKLQDKLSETLLPTLRICALSGIVQELRQTIILMKYNLNV